MDSITSRRTPWLVLRRTFSRLWLVARYRIFDRRYRRLVIEQVDEVSLVILPDVFNPILFRTGETLARFISSTYLWDEGNEARVLDLGCGSGIGAVFAARCGAHVIATDLNPAATRCAQINALLNRFEDKIETRLGDLFEPVLNERFDLVLFNPPFYLGAPKDSLDMAWRGEKIFERFAAGLRDRLTPTGCALIVLSSDGEGTSLLNELKANGFEINQASWRDFGNEVIAIYSVSNSKRVPPR